MPPGEGWLGASFGTFIVGRTGVQGVSFSERSARTTYLTQGSWVDVKKAGGLWRCVRDVCRYASRHQKAGRRANDTRQLALHETRQIAVWPHNSASPRELTVRHPERRSCAGAEGRKNVSVKGACRFYASPVSVRRWRKSKSLFSLELFLKTDRPDCSVGLNFPSPPTSSPLSHTSCLTRTPDVCAHPLPFPSLSSNLQAAPVCTSRSGHEARSVAPLLHPLRVPGLRLCLGRSSGRPSRVVERRGRALRGDRGLFREW